ncbi:alpha/beta hydrolase [Nocardioides litoris]|uniref:alpha/beta hydrolase n=1 Tax=Nocardioides litoris TaxID=1926648 RepID=UPI001123BBF9|nr:alpha/beta fold hydrolase [Nocardioides litoris]
MPETLAGDHAFTSRGTTCRGRLHRPAGSDAAGRRSRPAVVLGHGLGGTVAMRLEAYAERFAAAGYVALAFDYRHFGTSDGEPRQLLSVRRQLDDWGAAIASVRALPDVDGERVAVFGSSFGGGHALTLAGSDRRLAAAIAQCPFTDGVASTLAVPPLTGLAVTTAAVRDLARAARRAEPVYLPAAAAPGETAFMSSHDALAGMTALAPGGDVDRRLTARSALEVLRYAPGRHARRIACPTLVALCDGDTVAPDRPALRQVSRSPRVEVRAHPVGHFDIYLGEPFERAVAQYVEFLRRHVPVD